MKFISILTTVLFLFAATATFATENPSTPNQETELNKKKFGGGSSLIIIAGVANVSGGGGGRLVNADSFSMTVKILKGGEVLSNQTSNNFNIQLDLNHLSEGNYTAIVKTPFGIDVHKFEL